MSYQYTRENFAAADARIVPVAELETRGAVTRHFDLPPVLHAVTVGLYFAILGVFAFAFGEKAMIIPFAIFAIFVIGGFGVPALWSRMQPFHADQPLDWATFEREGVATHTGQLAAKDATLQVLILPVLILGWAVAIAVIAATV